MKKRLLRSAQQRANAKLVKMIAKFAKQEDGTFTIFVLFVILSMLCATGTGTDLMNFERDRANLQATLDRAVLAAADLDQTLPAKQIVESYMEKAGFDKNPPNVEVIEAVGSRTVIATAETTVRTNFMRLAGINTLTARVASTAEESIGSVEISLVLDVSGSMGRDSADPDKTKIAVLRESAKEFVSLMLKKPGNTTVTTGGTVSISIIPYATQVNAGAPILDQFTNVSSEHNYSHCLNFNSSDFLTPVLNKSANYNRTAPFDAITERLQSSSNAWPTCPTRAGASITAVTDNITTLHDQIDLLTAKGNTSIDIGMKWGTALLDPSFQTIVAKLSEDGLVPVRFNNRPAAYPSEEASSDEEPAEAIAPEDVDSGEGLEPPSDDDVLKIIIVMTDGQNTTQHVLDSEYRSGASDVWYNSAVNQYWVHDPDEDEYVRFIGQQWKQTSDGYWYRDNQYERLDHPFGAEDGEAGTPVRLTYPQLFNTFSLKYNARRLYGWQPNYEENWVDDIHSGVYSGSKDTRTSQICQQAKDKGIIVYGIAFEAPTHGLNTIKNCASSASHVYNVDGLDLEDAFESIASSIRKLRLTQ